MSVFKWLFKRLFGGGSDGSGPGSLGKLDWKKLGKSFGLSFCGFLGAWIATVFVPEAKQAGPLVGAALGTGAAWLSNFLLKLSKDTRPK